MITNTIPGTMMDKYFTDLDKVRSAIADTIAKHLGTELEVKIDQTRLVLDEENKIVYHAVVKEAASNVFIRTVKDASVLPCELYYTDKPPALTC
jgi:predicted short-subunit dehydrogenase-like oxidoreductase (DUF2520 family)